VSYRAPTDAPSTDEQAIARVEHAQRVAALRTLKRERRDLYLLALGYRYNQICRAHPQHLHRRYLRGVRVNIAVLVHSDVGDKSQMEAPAAVRRPLRGGG
jgi:hypothetical protein